MERKSLASNSVAFVIYKLMYVLFPLITSAYISHVLLAKGVGRIASAQNIAQYFVLIAALGIPTYGIREIAKTKNDIKDRNLVFSELFTINAFSSILCTIIYYIVIHVIWTDAIDPTLSGIVGLSIPLNILNVDWFYQGIEEFSYITKRSFVVRVISMILILAFVRKQEDITIYAVIYVLGISGNYLLNFINLHKHGVRVLFKDLSYRGHIKSILILLCTTVAIELYTMVDVTMLTFMTSEESVGYYSNSMKIVRIVVTVMAAIGGVLLPRLSLYYAQGMIKKCEEIINKVFSVILFLIVPCSVGIYYISDYLVPALFGQSFLPTIITLKISSFIVYSLGFFDLFGTQVLLTFHDENKLLFSTVAGAASNILLNRMLIPSFEQNGAAMASVISQMIVTLILFVYVNKRINISICIRTIITICISTVAMISSLEFVRLVNTNYYIHLIISVLLGFFVYSIVSLLLKNEVALYLMKKAILFISKKKSEVDT